MARSPNGARRLIEGERRAAKIHVVLVQETHRQVFPLVGTKSSLSTLYSTQRRETLRKASKIGVAQRLEKVFSRGMELKDVVKLGSPACPATTSF